MPTLLRLGAVPVLSVLFFGVLLLSAGGVMAQETGGVELTTPYPSLSLQAGDTGTFEVAVAGAGRRRVDLSLDGVPEEWTATLRGGGTDVDAVTTSGDPTAPTVVTLSVDVPETASESTTTITLVGDADGTTARLPVSLTVSEQAGGSVMLTSDFPSLQGPPDATFTFDATLTNDTPAEQTFALSATGPDGWSVTATPTSEEQATTATVAAGETATIRVAVDPPDDAATGPADIAVRATGAGQTAELGLTVELTGNPEIGLSTIDERLNAEVTLGQTTDTPLILTNTGTAPLLDVTLNATPPAGWEVAFEPDTIPQVAPGDIADVTARITPASDSVAGDYLVPISASGQDTAQQALEIRTTVNRSSAAGLIGVALIGAALLALTAVFRRFGRR